METEPEVLFRTHSTQESTSVQRSCAIVRDGLGVLSNDLERAIENFPEK
jgi:hypothetical protein